MTDTVAVRLRRHVASRGGPTLANGAWSMMLEAADALDHCDAAFASISQKLTTLLSVNDEIAEAIADDSAEIKRLTVQIDANRKRRHRIRAEIAGLCFAIEALRPTAVSDAAPATDPPLVVAEDRAAYRRRELQRLLASAPGGLDRTRLYCDSFLGVELDTAIIEGIAGGWLGVDEAGDTDIYVWIDPEPELPLDEVAQTLPPQPAAPQPDRPRGANPASEDGPGEKDAVSATPAPPAQ